MYQIKHLFSYLDQPCLNDKRFCLLFLLDFVQNQMIPCKTHPYIKLENVGWTNQPVLEMMHSKNVVHEETTIFRKWSKYSHTDSKCMGNRLKRDMVISTRLQVFLGCVVGKSRHKLLLYLINNIVCCYYDLEN